MQLLLLTRKYLTKPAVSNLTACFTPSLTVFYDADLATQHVQFVPPGLVRMHSIWSVDAKYLESNTGVILQLQPADPKGLDCPAHVMLPLQKRSKLWSSADDRRDEFRTFRRE
jgi:hypothetical protein